MLGWEQQKSRVIHRHQGWKGSIPDFASETVGSNSGQRLHKAGDGRAVMAGVGGGGQVWGGQRPYLVVRARVGRRDWYGPAMRKAEGRRMSAELLKSRNIRNR